MTEMQNELFARLLARPHTLQELIAELDEHMEPSALRMHVVRLRRVIRHMGLYVRCVDGRYTLMRNTTDAEDRMFR
jgi:hypothetical protein